MLPTDDAPADPLAVVFPEPCDRMLWRRTNRSVAADTGESVLHYRHRVSGRTLRLDAQCRVYGQDPEGKVRLFGRGGPLALAVAINVVLDGVDHQRPTQVVLPGTQRRPDVHAAR